MIQGEIRAGNEAVIRIRITGPRGSDTEIESVIDTGFTGSLTLSSSIIASLGLEFLHATQAELADGSEIWIGVYRAAVLWDGEERVIRVFEADGGSVTIEALF